MTFSKCFNFNFVPMDEEPRLTAVELFVVFMLYTLAISSEWLSVSSTSLMLPAPPLLLRLTCDEFRCGTVLSCALYRRSRKEAGNIASTMFPRLDGHEKQV
jgi:hypothetical protein